MVATYYGSLVWAPAIGFTWKFHRDLGWGQFEGRFANPLQKNSGWPNEDMINELRDIGAVLSLAAVDQHGRCDRKQPWWC